MGLRFNCARMGLSPISSFTGHFVWRCRSEDQASFCDATIPWSRISRKHHFLLDLTLVPNSGDLSFDCAVRPKPLMRTLHFPRKQCHIKAFKLRQLSSVPKKYGSREMQDSAAIYKPGFLHPGQERTRSTIVIGQTAAGQAFEPGWSFFFLGFPFAKLFSALNFQPYSLQHKKPLQTRPIPHSSTPSSVRRVCLL